MIDEHSREVARSLALRYVVWSTIILAASGALGVILRFSQAVPDARVGDNFWYALMTAHGLGAFVGWAGFAVMDCRGGCSPASGSRCAASASRWPA